MMKNRWIAVTLICSLLGATPVLAASADENVESHSSETKLGKSDNIRSVGNSVNHKGPEVVKYADLDSSFQEAVEKAITQYGNGKSIQFEKAFKDEYVVDENKKLNRWLIENKDRSAIVSVDAASGKVLTISITFDVSEITGDYEKYLTTVHSSVKQLGSQSERPFTIANLFISNIEANKSQSITFSTHDDQFIKLDLKTSKPLNYHLKFKEADIDRKIVAAAEQAVQSLGVKKLQPFTQFELHKNEGLVGENGVWILKRRIEVKYSDRNIYKAIQRDHDNKWYFVESEAVVERKTGKIVSVTVAPKTVDQKQVKLTQKQGVALAKPIAKKLFGVDLSSYQVKVDNVWGDYKFSSKDKQSIIAKFDNYGNLVRIERMMSKR
ncbi:hypothetical protein [Paenibacillus arenosi]|uniref:PepSY domain-containing protein n=1 Tax=Paenibacillus arenosi TaxID=2774142 RepID=A0ABR9AUC0_9BACL|nr:hypothetical protein [Paenibacillus arenosi]MBD8497716.1 hypothetical protein [Paenibacillus arenosi]